MIDRRCNVCGVGHAPAKISRLALLPAGWSATLLRALSKIHLGRRVCNTLRKRGQAGRDTELKRGSARKHCLTQYFDTLKDIGSSGHSNTILMPHSPGALKDFFDQIRNAIVLGETVTATRSDLPPQGA